MSFPVTYDDNSTEYVGKEIGHGAQGSIYACLDGENAVKLFYEPDSPSSLLKPEYNILQRFSKEFDPGQRDPLLLGKQFCLWLQSDEVLLEPRLGCRDRLFAECMRSRVQSTILSLPALSALPPTDEGWFWQSGRRDPNCRASGAHVRSRDCGLSLMPAI